MKHQSHSNLIKLLLNVQIESNVVTRSYTFLNKSIKLTATLLDKIPFSC